MAEGAGIPAPSIPPLTFMPDSNNNTASVSTNVTS